MAEKDITVRLRNAVKGLSRHLDSMIGSMIVTRKQSIYCQATCQEDRYAQS